MTNWLVRLYAVFLVALPASARTDELFTITPDSHVALGDSGDTFGMEKPSSSHVVILLNPDGEDCTLRFPLRHGEGFRLFVRAGLDQKLSCQISLNTTGEGQTATFTSRCEQVEARSEASGARRCPAPN